jgi:hypothetical protein
MKIVYKGKPLVEANKKVVLEADRENQVHVHLITRLQDKIII